MEFSSRGFQRNNSRPAATANATSDQASINGPNKTGNKKAFHKIKSSKALSVLSGILFVSILILVIAILLGISTKSTENSVVQKNRYQAVFLNGGQAYFGKVKTLNDRFIDLSDIYYISTNGQSNENTQANISLVKLGSELHCPQDRMIINRDQVLFWENLNDDGKVVNAIKQWQKENPNGQKCNNQTTQQQTPAQNSDESQTDSSNSDSSRQGSTGNNSSSSTGADASTSNTPSGSTPSTDGGNASSNQNQGTTPSGTPNP